MGASARKENNDRSRQLFSESNAIAQKPFSDQETASLRQRAVSPIQAAYAHSMDELKRAKSLGGAGGSPNYIAALAKTNRDRTASLSSGLNDANANLASMTLQGRLGGLNAASGVRPIEGFGWGKLAGLIGSGLGAASGAGLFSGAAKAPRIPTQGLTVGNW